MSHAITTSITDASITNKDFFVFIIFIEFIFIDSIVGLIT